MGKYSFSECIRKLTPEECREFNVGTSNNYVLLKDFVYKNVIVPAGFTCDLCSVKLIPKRFRWKTFLMHDWFYYSHKYKITDEINMTKNAADDILCDIAKFAFKFTDQDESAWENGSREFKKGLRIIDINKLRTCAAASAL